MIPFHKRIIQKADGRSLWLYSNQPATVPILDEDGLAAATPISHLRWHPLRQEWVCYAAHRQGRTFQPPETYCPLCPTQNDQFPTEIPCADFEIAVFENRFSAFSRQASPPPILNLPTASAVGRCEVVVYSAGHQDTLGTLTQQQRELLIQVWCDRYQTLLQEEAIQFVMPFENRGEEVGVTLHHPHGQIYAFSYLPPVVETMAQSFAEKPVLQSFRQSFAEQYDVITDSEVVAFVPPWMRYPYELWITTLSFRPGLWHYKDSELCSLATVLGKVAQLYDRLFARPMPYLMLLYAAPKGAEASFQFHIQFLPFLRTADKLKYLAGCETGAGTFLADMLPEDVVQHLRQVAHG
jgi:UDPglucose--hexose-1-phosphate uridylyltransferase